MSSPPDRATVVARTIAQIVGSISAAKLRAIENFLRDEFNDAMAEDMAQARDPIKRDG